MASIITPATLSIESRMQLPPPTSARYAPTINFNTLSYLAPSPTTGWGWYYWGGPSQTLTRLATAVGAQGTILPIDPPSANATWRAEFRGPVLRCQSLSADEMFEIRRNIKDFLLARPPWSGGSTMPRRRNLDFAATDYLDIQTTFRVAVFAQAISMYSQTRVYPEYASDTDQQKWFGDLIETQNATALQCKLFESSYRTLFEYTNGNQTVTVDASRTEDDEEYGYPFVGLVGPFNASCPGFHLAPLDDASTEMKDRADACYFDPETTRPAAYQAMFEAFSQAISGPITPQPWKSGNVIRTKLMEAAEIYGMSDGEVMKESNYQWL